MRLDQLQLDLRPRPHAHALDLGFQLLRCHAGPTWGVWLVLWLSAMALCAAATWWAPEYGFLLMTGVWWLRPLFERAPLYVLSRRVFGEAVTWRQALRAWPGQLRGGTLLLLTLWRPLILSRGLYQAVWQLEGARGQVASQRRRVLALDGTGSAAWWFGMACGFFELILMVALIAFVGIFLGQEDMVNPLGFLANLKRTDLYQPHVLSIALLAFTLAGAVVGPIYTACCFTLYLNRRAQLEAWDIEIMLRQIKPPQRPATGVVALMLAALLILPLLAPAPAQAASTGRCKPLATELARERERGPSQNAEQQQIRDALRRLYQRDELRSHDCLNVRVMKPRESGKKKENSRPQSTSTRSSSGFAFNGDLLALLFKIILIGVGLAGAFWLLYRYRDQIPVLGMRRRLQAATEVGGLDIRPESLPDDVAGSVRRLWAEGEQRAALALLFRATLSTLVLRHGLQIGRGSTEGDCVRIARRTLQGESLHIVEQTTTLWLDAAWGKRWPDDEIVEACCAEWQRQFGAGVRP